MTRHDLEQQFCQPISFNSYQFELTRRRLMWFNFSFAHFDNMVPQIYPALASWSQYNDISQCRGGKRRPCVNLMHRCDQTKFTYFTYLHTCTDVILTYFTNSHRCDQTWEHIQRAREAEAWWWIVQLVIVAREKIAISQYIFILSFK